MDLALAAGLGAVATRIAAARSWGKSQRFADPEAELAYQIDRFGAGSASFITFASAATVVVAGVAMVSPEANGHLFGPLVLGGTLVVLVRAWLQRMPDQRGARILFGRFFLGLCHVVSATSPAAMALYARLSGSAPFRLEMGRDTAASVALLWVGLCFTLRISGLDIVHTVGSMGIMAATEAARAALFPSALGRTCDLLGVAVALVIIEDLGRSMETQMRQAFLARVRMSAAPRGDAALASGPNTDACHDSPAISMPTINVLWSHFSDERAEEEYTTARFSANAPPFIALCLVLILNLALIAVFVPELSVRDQFFTATLALCTAALLRVWLSRLADQQRARLLCGRTLVVGEVVFAARLVQRGLMGKLLPVTAFELGCIIGSVSVLLILMQLSALHREHRFSCLALVAMCELCRIALSPSVLGHIFEGIAVFAALLVVHAVCYTLEWARRTEFAHLDMSKRKLQLAEERAREAASKVESVTRSSATMQQNLVSYLFHELRNDANATVGIMDLLCESAEVAARPFASDHLELLADGRAHAHHAAQVITNLLDWVKLQANELRLPEDQPYQLGRLGAECTLLVKHLLRGKPVVLAAEMALPAVTLLGAPLHLKQVLLNLLTNAAKHTSEGRITLSAVEETSPSGRGAADCVRVRFSVEDTGSGVSAARRTKIFEEFQQDATAVKPGTGLGLPLCSALVALMGGRLEHSVPRSRVGSLFSFACVLRRVPEPEAAPLAPAPTLPALPGGLRVLVADDLPLNRKLLVHALSRVLPGGPHFTEVESGEAALDLLLGSGAFDLACLDENFTSKGEMRGREVTRRLRAHEQLQAEQRAKTDTSRPRRVVIVGVTGDQGCDSFEDTALTMGQDVIWGKPTPTPAKMLQDLLPLLGR